MKNRIKVYRAMRNITQEELADQLPGHPQDDQLH